MEKSVDDSDDNNTGDDFELLTSDQLRDDDAASSHRSLASSVLSMSSSLLELSGDVDSTVQMVSNDDAVSKSTMAISCDQQEEEEEEKKTSMQHSGSGSALLDNDSLGADEVVSQLRHSEQVLSAWRGGLQELQSENETLRVENEQNKQRVQMLRLKLEALEKENQDLVSRFEQSLQAKELALQNVQNDLSTLQSLNVALQMQVEADADHVTALCDRYQIQMDMLRHGEKYGSPPPEAEWSIDALQQTNYTCLACSEPFETEQRLLIHLHRCDQYQRFA